MSMLSGLFYKISAKAPKQFQGHFMLSGLRTRYSLARTSLHLYPL